MARMAHRRVRGVEHALVGRDAARRREVFQHARSTGPPDVAQRLFHPQASPQPLRPSIALRLAPSCAKKCKGVRKNGRGEELRLRHHRCRLRRLCAGQPAQRRPRRPGPGAGGRRLGPRSAGSTSRSPGARSSRNRLHDWMYFTEPEPQFKRPQGGMRPRQGGRRLVLDQRHDLCHVAIVETTTAGPRTACRNWSYAQALPYFKKQETWEGGASAAPRRWAARHRAGRPSATRWLDAYAAGHQSAGLKWNDDLNSGQQRRYRPQPEHHPQRAALQRRGGLSAARAWQRQQSHGRDQRAGGRASCSTAIAPSAWNIGRAARPTPSAPSAR